MRKASRWRLLPALGIAAAFVLSLTPAASAGPTQGGCVLSLSTGKFDCFATAAEAIRQGDVRAKSANDLRGAVLFTEENYNGRALVLTVPKDCPKDNLVNYWRDLKDDLTPWRNHVYSMESYGACWIWLYRENGTREGEFRDNVPKVPLSINTSVVTVGLS